MNLDRLAELKMNLEAGKFDCGIAGQIVNKYEASATVYCDAGKAPEILRILMKAPSDLRDLTTALEAAQERIAQLEAQRDALYVADRSLLAALEAARERIADQDADIKRLERALLSMGQALQGIK